MQKKGAVHIHICRITCISFFKQRLSKSALVGLHAFCFSNKKQLLAIDFVRLCACRFPNVQPLAFDFVGLLMCISHFKISAFNT